MPECLMFILLTGPLFPNGGRSTPELAIRFFRHRPLGSYRYTPNSSCMTTTSGRCAICGREGTSFAKVMHSEKGEILLCAVCLVQALQDGHLVSKHENGGCGC